MVTDWTSIALSLSNKYFATESPMLAKSQYFDAFQFSEDDPLAPFVPPVGIERFFGTKVLNIFVVSKPFGWAGANGGDPGEYSWPPDGYEASKARLIASYKYFASYQTLVWMDMTSDGGECEEGGISWTEMMNQTAEGIAAMCAELSAYGFSYMGEITSTPDLYFFKPYLDDHYTNVPPD